MQDATLYHYRTVDEAFKDFEGRREGIIRALTRDVNVFREKCVPGNRNLGLYGLPNGKWVVSFPADVRRGFPQSRLRLNFSREEIEKDDWLALVAADSDAWLLYVSLFLGVIYGFDKTERERLFKLMNDLPTIYEVVTEEAKKQVEDKSTVSYHSSNKSKSNSKAGECLKRQLNEEDDGSDAEEDDEHGDTLDGACGVNSK